jgi:hypothetical protein
MEDRRERPGEDCMSEMSGMELSGGTNTVDRDPLLEWLASLSIVSMVRMEPVGDRVTDTESGTLIGLLTASLSNSQNQEET